MRKMGLGIALLVSMLLTISLIGVLYLGKVAFGLPFVPEDLYGFLVGSGFGPLLTLYRSLADGSTADQAGFLIAVLLFLILGLLIGLLFHLLAGRKTYTPDLADGVAIGALFGAPLLLVSLNSGFSVVHPLLQALWLTVLFVAWGVVLAAVYRRMGRGEHVGPPIPPLDEAELAAEGEATDPAPPSVAQESRVGRRQFLLRLGASAAAVTAISGAAAAALGGNGRISSQRRALPMANPEIIAQYQNNFRRFSIIQLLPEANEGEVKVLALGTEYPDHHYVSIWIGEQSPIVIYENIETALGAYRRSGGELGIDVQWLDN